MQATGGSRLRPPGENPPATTSEEVLNFIMT